MRGRLARVRFISTFGSIQKSFGSKNKVAGIAADNFYPLSKLLNGSPLTTLVTLKSNFKILKFLSVSPHATSAQRLGKLASFE